MVGCGDFVFTCSAIAVRASRTLANVKSSAITPRQPEVPNLMGEVVCNPALVLMARYFSLSRYGAKDCARRGAKATRGMRECGSQPNRIVLHVEGQARIRPRAPADYENKSQAPYRFGEGSEAPAHLRRAGVYYPLNHRGLGRLPLLAKRQRDQACLMTSSSLAETFTRTKALDRGRR